MNYKRVLIDETGESHVLKDIEHDFHTKDGFLKKEDLKKKGWVKNSKGKTVFICDPAVPDVFRKLNRHAQIMTLKDIGAILAYCGINKNSVVADAGSGSGAIACIAGLIAKKVVTYDIDDRSIETTKKNIELFDLKNVTVKKESIYEPQGTTKQKQQKPFADVFTLDVPQPWDALLRVKEILKSGGFLVSYSPHITQAQKMVVEAQQKGFIHLKTTETIERNWTLDENRARPNFDALGHTGFLSFLRKVE